MHFFHFIYEDYSLCSLSLLHYVSHFVIRLCENMLELKQDKTVTCLLGNGNIDGSILNILFDLVLMCVRWSRFGMEFSFFFSLFLSRSLFVQNIGVSDKENELMLRFAVNFCMEIEKPSYEPVVAICKYLERNYKSMKKLKQNEIQSMFDIWNSVLEVCSFIFCLNPILFFFYLEWEGEYKGERRGRLVYVHIFFDHDNFFFRSKIAKFSFRISFSTREVVLIWRFRNIFLAFGKVPTFFEYRHRVVESLAAALDLENEEEVHALDLLLGLDMREFKEVLIHFVLRKGDSSLSLSVSWSLCRYFFSLSLCLFICITPSFYKKKKTTSP